MEDWISLLVIPYTILPYCIAIYTNTVAWMYLGCLVVLSIATTEAIKGITKDLPYPCLKRPIGARNCNSTVSDGNQSGRPGFPSGHCAGTATFWVGVWLLFPSSYKLPMGILAGINILSMMWARQKKRCHTLIQTIAGIIVGSVYAMFLK